MSDIKKRYPGFISTKPYSWFSTLSRFTLASIKVMQNISQCMLGSDQTIQLNKWNYYNIYDDALANCHILNWESEIDFFLVLDENSTTAPPRSKAVPRIYGPLVSQGTNWCCVPVWQCSFIIFLSSRDIFFKPPAFCLTLMYYSQLFKRLIDFIQFSRNLDFKHFKKPIDNHLTYKNKGWELSSAATLASQPAAGHSLSFIITIVIMTLGWGLFVGLAAEGCGQIWLPCLTSSRVTILVLVPLVMGAVNMYSKPCPFASPCLFYILTRFFRCLTF